MGRPPREMKRPKRKLKLPLPTEEDLFRNEETRTETDLEVMDRLMELQKRPEYQYDEKNMYEGPRDMRMGGGIMSIPRQNYGFGSFVSSVFKGAKDIVSDVVDVAKDIADPVAQVASFIPGPHQPFAAAYTAGRGAGIGGSDYGGLQIGGFTPSGGFGGFGGSGGGFGLPGAGTGFQAGTGSMPNLSSFGDFNLSDALKLANTARQITDTGVPGTYEDGVYRPGDVYGMPGQEKPGVDYSKILKGVAGIAGKLIKPAVAGTGAALAYKDQQRINQLQEQAYKDFIARQEAKRQQYRTGEGLPSLPVTGRSISKKDVIGRRGVMGGGMMDLDVRTNPQGVKEIDYRKKGGFVPPIGIKEKADDIPAMLSNNEFVFTADAVRGAGKGNVNEGAKKMYTLMKKLESGGKV